MWKLSTSSKIHRLLIHYHFRTVQTRMSQNTDEKPTISTLPAEIEDQIITSLEPSAVVALRQVNRHFTDTASLHRLDKKDVQHYLHEMEQCGRHTWGQGNFACFTCLQIKPKGDFSRSQIRGLRGKNGWEPYQRFCVACGLGHREVPAGNIVRSGDGRKIFCRGCRAFKANWCTRCRFCRSCNTELRQGEVIETRCLFTFKHTWERPGTATAHDNSMMPMATVIP